ncbi:MAG: NAD-dependent epimerase/dehydratase family protein [Acetobacteraceae bacterium]
MKVFLTGATGYVGNVLLHRLLAEGHAVEALARPVPGRALPVHAGLSWLQGDLRDGARLAEAARRADATIHTAAEHAGAQQEADAAATDALIEGLRGSGKPLISTSATVVYGDTGLSPRGEAGPIAAPHPLRVWRIANDERIASQQNGLRGCVIRPPNIFGAGGGPIAMRIAAAAKAGFVQYVDDGAARWSTVHVFDLVRLFLMILSNERAHGIYNAASDEVLSRRELADGIAVTLGPDVPTRSITLEEGRAIWGFLADLGLVNQVISAARAHDDLGWVTRCRPLMSYLKERNYGDETVEDA